MYEMNPFGKRPTFRISIKAGDREFWLAAVSKSPGKSLESTRFSWVENWQGDYGGMAPTDIPVCHLDGWLRIISRVKCESVIIHRTGTGWPE